MGLVEAVARAQSGYRSDVVALKQELERADVFIPLAESTGTQEGRQTLREDARIAIHNLRSGDGTAWIPLFTSQEALEAAGARNAWKTGDGPLRFLSLKGATALDSMFESALRGGANAGVVIDAGGGSELALTADEVLHMVDGDPIPLVDYAARQPTRENEEVMVGWPAEPPSPELQDAIATVLRGEGSIKSFAIRQVFMPERDVAAHLLLDVAGEVAETDRRRISERVGAAVAGIKLPGPGYLDVAFNFATDSAS